VTPIHRTYQVHPRWAGTRWELHISGVGMTTARTLERADAAAKAYIRADLGERALVGAEIVVLDPQPRLVGA
jgi:hypothetical protein